jgi:DNA replication initiation complex subunit (GINS family)
MGDKDVVITYETLFELLRLEKSRDELQKLDESFYENVLNYLNEKKNSLSSQAEQLFADEEREKVQKELVNIRKILRDLYDRREKKIIELALNKSRTESSLIDTSVLLEQEKKFFDSMLSVLNNFRQNILCNLINAEPPVAPEMLEKPVPVECAEEPEEEPKDLKKPENDPNINKSVRFLRPVPKFVGPNLEIYGPFEEEDVASLPAKVADVLVQKGRAEGLEAEKSLEQG